MERTSQDALTKMTLDVADSILDWSFFYQHDFFKLDDLRRSRNLDITRPAVVESALSLLVDLRLLFYHADSGVFSTVSDVFLKKVEASPAEA